MSIHSAGIGHNSGPILALVTGQNGDLPLSPELAEDLLEEAGPIAKFIWGVDDLPHRRKVYRWASEVNPRDRLPTFRRGGNKKSVICARKSTILKWIAERERHVSALAGGDAT